MIRMTLHLFGYDLRAFARNRQWQFFTLALPVRQHPAPVMHQDPRTGQRRARPPVNPVLSARCRNSTSPACDTTPRPPPVTSRPLDQPVTLLT